MGSGTPLRVEIKVGQQQQIEGPSYRGKASIASGYRNAGGGEAGWARGWRGGQETSPCVLRKFLFIPSPLDKLYPWECTLSGMKYVLAPVSMSTWLVFSGPVNTVVFVDFLFLSHPCIPASELHWSRCVLNPIGPWI